MTTAKGVAAEELAATLNNSGSATVYVDIAGVSKDTTTILTDSDPPLHVEFDQVRQLYAVRQATAEEVDEAKAAAAATSSSSSSTSTTSTTSTTSA